MKKSVVFLLVLFATLSGCSTKETSPPSIVTDVDQSSGLYDYITGEAPSYIKSVISEREDGFRDQVSIKGKKFDLGIPASITDEKLKLKVVLKNRKKETLEIKMPKRAVIDSYENFAERMNTMMNDLDEGVETRFPITSDDGTFIADDKKDV